MEYNMRRFLHTIQLVKSIHYVHLTSFPAERTSELKEINILPLIKDPIIFVMRGPVFIQGVSELLELGNGVIFDYEKFRLERQIHLTVSQNKPYVSPGILNFIREDIEEYKQKGKTFFINEPERPLSAFTARNRQSVIDLLLSDHPPKKNSTAGRFRQKFSPMHKEPPYS
ncbi:hypothetical protein [Salipaludibacillus aurantiacus]|uniref:Uncharacterized protein n=1 Tax=Salipaludibacillus aurantiacus TaxID=1601833 RepID=A0A1H9WAA7_9BACI|nr:hypothetical protein [Salipaludibacillus aurantiacus]SES30872.1 hypothetical protein SAMN05518684_11591 [Salipaludibacillus aurantiacus]